MTPDLRHTRALIVVFVMPGCGACEEFLPRLLKLVAQHQAAGTPFRVWQPGQPLHPGEIPVLIYDAASEDAELQAFADRLKITATPTTALMTRTNTARVEGAIDDAQASRLLLAAAQANR
jgi:thiol-disulfide isomerase/thioredoxin